MITLLSKLIIKNYKEFENPNVRLKYGILCGAVGILFNILLFTGKLIAGTSISGPMANFTDKKIQEFAAILQDAAFRMRERLY